MAQLNDLGLDRNLYKAPLEGDTWDAQIIAANNAENPIDPIATGNAATDINQGTVTVDGAQLTPGSPIPQSAFNIANLGWTQTSVFTSASLNTVTWTSGIFTSADGVSRSISSGTTGVMTTTTYIYLNINVSSTAYQVTTSQADVIGPGRVLIAVAQNGTAAATFNTVQTELITANNIFVNSLSAISANLGTITAGSININNLSFIGSNGLATFIGVATLNKKAYTNFEASTRFTNTQTGSASAPVFANQGVTISPSATATSSSLLVWDVGNVFTNYPTFTCTAIMLSVNSGDARGFIGLGSPSVNGSGIIYSGNSQIGFRVDKTSGVMTVSSEMNDGGSGTSVGATLFHPVVGDVFELFIRVTSTAVFWYYRVNGGTLTLGDTQTTHIPTGTGEDNIRFAMSNAGSANDIQIVLQCAGYEH